MEGGGFGEARCQRTYFSWSGDMLFKFATPESGGALKEPAIFPLRLGPLIASSFIANAPCAAKSSPVAEDPWSPSRPIRR